MGLGFALFLHVILFGLLLGILWPFFWLLRRLLGVTSPSTRRAFRLGHIALAGAPFGLFVASIVWMNVAPPSYLYRSVFGRGADSSIENLRGTSEGINDAQEVFLAFKAPNDTLSTLLSSAQFAAADSSSGADLVPLPSADPVPTWWTAPQCAERSTYVARNARQWDDIVLTRCEDDHTIYVQARWID